MRLLDSTAYCAALDEVAEHVLDLSCFKQGILVTGASGLIGSAVVDLLLWLRKRGGFKGDIVAAGRSVLRLEERFGRQDGICFVKYSDVVDGRMSSVADGFVLAASPASPNLFLTESDAVVKTNTQDVEMILSSIAGRGVRVVYVSSSEVYGDAVAPDGGHVENVLGKIRADDVRSCYAISKLKAEDICMQFAHRGLGVAIVRPGHVYGPTALPSDKRVSSAWAYSVVRGEDIVMKSDGCQLRSYTHCLDCAAAILTVLAKGVQGEAYNISNRNSVITIRRLAEMLSGSAGVALRVEVPSQIEREAFNPMINSSLNATKLESLGWQGVLDAETGLENTISVLRDVARGVQ